MKKSVVIAVALMCVASLFVSCTKKEAKKADGTIKIGIINNPPSESGYRAANVKDFESVFTASKGYKVSTFYSLKNDEQLNAASQFITSKEKSLSNPALIFFHRNKCCIGIVISFNFRIYLI